MSNQAKVITKIKMKPGEITAIIERLNTDRFKNLLEIKGWKGEKGDWGKYVWFITVKGDKDGLKYGYRECWLNNVKSFEIRHFSGGSFMWWIDFSITNEVALAFDGTTRDDAADNKIKPGLHKYDSWNDLVMRLNFNRGLPDFELERTPKEFQNVKIYTTYIQFNAYRK